MTKSTAPSFTRRTLAKTGAAAAAGLAASRLSVPQTSAKQNGEVTFLNWSALEGTPFPAALKAFQETTGITVTVQPTPTTDYETKFRTLLASGSPPDVMRINDNYVRDFAVAGQLLDLKPFIKSSDPYIESLFTFPITPEGTHPAWSIGNNPRAIFYNVSMFEEAGILPPPGNWTSENWSWDDFLETAKQLTDADAQRWGALIYHDLGWEQTWVVNNGLEAGIYSEDGTKFTFADPQGIEAMQWVADLTCKHGVQPPWSMLQQDEAANQLFAGGRVGMMFGTLGFTTYLRQNVKDFTWDVAPVPAKVNQMQEGSLIVFCIPKDARNPEAAWQLLEFLAGPEAGKIFAEAGYFVPVWEEAGSAIRPGDEPPAHIGIFTEAAQHNTVVAPNAVGQNVAAQIYRPQVDRVWSCEASAEEVLVSVREQVEETLVTEQ